MRKIRRDKAKRNWKMKKDIDMKKMKEERRRREATDEII